MKTTRVPYGKAPAGWPNNPEYVYIGRNGKQDAGRFGNPHPIGYCFLCARFHDREDCLNMFEADILEWVKSPAYLEKLEQLRGKVLVCFCSLEQKCHGDIYIRVLEGRL